MSGDRYEAASRLVSVEEVRQALGLATTAAARAWLSDHRITQVQGYPEDEVQAEIASRPGRGNWGPRTSMKRKAKEGTDERS